MFNHTMNTFSPRIGFAWDPTKPARCRFEAVSASSTIGRRTSWTTTTTPILRVSPWAAHLRTLRAICRCSRSEPLLPALQFPLPPGLTAGLESAGRTDQWDGQCASRRSQYAGVVHAELVPWGATRFQGLGWRNRLYRLRGAALVRHLQCQPLRWRLDPARGKFTGLTPGFSAINYGQAK